jgi:hypothetical protein
MIDFGINNPFAFLGLLSLAFAASILLITFLIEKAWK